MAYRRKAQPRKRMKLFFKAKEGKNGAEYWEAKNRSGVRAQLFKANANDIEYTLSISMPAPKKQYRKRRTVPMGGQDLRMIKEQNAIMMAALMKR